MNHADAGSPSHKPGESVDDDSDVLDEISRQLDTAEGADPAESVEILAAVTSLLNAELEADQGES